MATSPTTPRSSYANLPMSSRNMDSATTPTKATFSSAALASQRPLPSSPFRDAVQIPHTPDNKPPKRAVSQISRKSLESDDMDMDDSDGEGDDAAISDDESLNTDGTHSNKKKKSQRFYCTDYPPCNLSFTRSEHLARHIRKHTGERPFQCHCSRRFSRLDNLRQHAQTVHVNEDIPLDSLAATGTRYQRQIRTDRLRTTGGRSRASTAGSVGASARGHSKSLSTSSIASIGSIGSIYHARDDARRRPPPLVMAASPQANIGEGYNGGSDNQFGYRQMSPSDYSTPTSATFSTGQNSPRWSTMASPTTAHSRTQSMYTSGPRTPGRRLSVPSGVNPFQSPHGSVLGRPPFTPGYANSSHPAAFAANEAHMVTSPTSSSGWSRRESMSNPADDTWRRRTWHPDSREFAAGSSRLSNMITSSQIGSPEAPLPLANPAAQQSSIRLPGIDSFGPIPRTGGVSPGRAPSPMAVDSDPNPGRNVPFTSGDRPTDDRRNVGRWGDGALHRGLTGLKIEAHTPTRDSAGAWAQDAHQAVQAQAEQVRTSGPTVRFEEQAQIMHIPSNPNARFDPPRRHQHTMSAPLIATTREMKRHGWYNGPMNTPAGQPRSERGSRVERMVHPNVEAFQGFPARVPQTVHEQRPLETSEPPAGSDNMRRLEALVAVATGQNSTAAAY